MNASRINGNGCFSDRMETYSIQIVPMFAARKTATIRKSVIGFFVNNGPKTTHAIRQLRPTAATAQPKVLI